MPNGMGIVSGEQFLNLSHSLVKHYIRRVKSSWSTRPRSKTGVLLVSWDIYNWNISATAKGFYLCLRLLIKQATELNLGHSFVV